MSKFLKSIGSVLAGFFAIVILSVVTDLILEKLGIFPPQNQPQLYATWMLAVALIYRSIYAVVGGYVAATLAPNRPMKHVFVLAVIGTVLGTLGAVANWGKTSPSTAWYPIALVPVSLFCVWLGGRLKTKSK